MTSRLTRAELLRRAAVGSAIALAPATVADTARAALGGALTVVNGNKPGLKFTSAFTRRLGKFPRTAYYPLHDPHSASSEAAVAFVIDEILVGADAAKNHKVTGRLLKLGAVDTGFTVFTGLEGYPVEKDVHIWRLKRTPGTKPFPDVASVVWQTRLLLGGKSGIPFQQVAPNHILIPSNWHSCPFGPPDEPEPGFQPPIIQALGEKPVDVVVIDSGYIEGPTITPRITNVDYAQWFTGTANRQPGRPFGPPYDWINQPPEELDADRDKRLDALAGHAGFIAGVIAQATPQARITVADHNGRLVWHDDADTPVSTEASVARSLWTYRAAAIIHVGFAFPTLANAQQAANIGVPGPPSWTFQVVLDQIHRETTMVVCPAGNQNSTVAQYPAAFHLDRRYQNVIGVGSISPQGGRSSFSNHGAWVACCTEGEDVHSTFSPSWSGPTEEADAPGTGSGSQPKNFNSGWARWSGTSFAAPKVTAAIADRIQSAGSAPAAWNSLKASYPQPNPGLQMGAVMSGLAPT